MAPKRKIGQQKAESGSSKKAKTVTFSETDGVEVQEAAQDGVEEDNIEGEEPSELKKVDAPKKFQPIFTRKSVLDYEKLRQGEVEVWLVQHPIDFDLKKLHNKKVDIDFGNKFGHAAVIDEEQQVHLYNDLPKSHKHLRGLFPVKGSLASAPIHRRLSVVQGVDPDWQLTQARNALDQGSDPEIEEEDEEEGEGEGHQEDEENGQPIHLRNDDLTVIKEEKIQIDDGGGDDDDVVEVKKEKEENKMVEQKGKNQDEEGEEHVHKKKKKKKDKKEKKK